MNEFDRVLSETLRERTQGAPRAGLESRILSRTFAEEVSSRPRGRTLIALAACALGATIFVRAVFLSAGSTQPELWVAARSQLKPADLPFLGRSDSARLQERASFPSRQPRMKLRRANGAASAKPRNFDSIAAIEIKPLSIAPIEVGWQGSKNERGKVKSHEATWWNAVLVCNVDSHSGDGSAGEASSPCKYTLVSYASFPADDGAEVFSKRGRVAPTGHAEHHD